jgi:hypothetical protein
VITCGGTAGGEGPWSAAAQQGSGRRRHLRTADVAVGDDGDGQGALHGGDRGEVGGAAPAVALAAALAAVDGDEGRARLLEKGAELDRLGFRLEQADLACDGNRNVSVHCVDNRLHQGPVTLVKEEGPVVPFLCALLRAPKVDVYAVQPVVISAVRLDDLSSPGHDFRIIAR